MQIAPVDSVYDDDANQRSSATAIVIKETEPLIDGTQSKWPFLCRLVNCYHIPFLPLIIIIINTSYKYLCVEKLLPAIFH